MLALAEFIAKLAGMMGGALHNLREVREDQRQKQSQYLDSVSETLAGAALAIQTGADPTRHLAELRFHLENIYDVLRYGDPAWLMRLSDHTVSRLRGELDGALEQWGSFVYSEASSDEREELKNALLNASGIFRGAFIALKASDKRPPD